MLTVEDIMNILPHRPPFLLVDRVLEIERDKRIVGLKNVTINEPFFAGHFPGKAIMPGVLIVEAMAQIMGVLYMVSTGADSKEKLVYFMGIDKVRFRRQVVPGDQLRIELEVLSRHARAWKVKATALVDGKIAAAGEIMAAVGDR